MTAPGNNNFGPTSLFVSQSLHHFADAAMCSAVAPALTGFVFVWEKRSAHYWQTFAVHFPQVGDIKTLLSNLQSARALSEEPLREAPPKNQDIPETESNQSLVSAKLLMCSFRSCSAQENPLWPRFPQGNASAVSAGHFLSPKYRLVTLKTSLLICSQGLVRSTLCVREAPTKSRTSQKMKATSPLCQRSS